jgi:hypothetical protein
LPDSTPVSGKTIYMVVTAIAFDSTLNEEVESVFSEETLGSP